MSRQRLDKLNARMEADMMLEAHLARRPNLLSVTVVRSRSSIPFGLELYYDEELDRVCVNSIQTDSLLDVDNPRADQFVAPNTDVSALQPGDALESINEFPCENKFVGDIQAYLDDLIGCVTFVVSTTRQQQAQQSGILCQTIVVRHDFDNTNNDDSAFDFLEELEFCQRPQGLLQIQNAPSLLPVRPNDLVIAVNNTPAMAQLTALNAQRIYQASIQPLLGDDTSSDNDKTCQQKLVICSVTVLQQSQAWSSKLRKTAVAVGGGTLVSVGAIVMATPLHPVGHVMALSGVGVLGTEFEAPRKAWEAARNRVQMLSSKKQDTDDDNNTK